jgi:hypothetical protein
VEVNDTIPLVARLRREKNLNAPRDFLKMQVKSLKASSSGD